MSNHSLDDWYKELQKSQLKGRGLPPVEKWNPALSGDIDIRITRQGVWFHEGGEIKRQPLVKLFSSILKRENDDYFLVTPEEKWRIQVEDVPFFITGLSIEQKGHDQALVFSSTTDDQIIAGEDHPVRVVVDTVSGEPSPYILLRGGMEGLISRNVYYQLADISEARQIDGQEVFGVRSMGAFFPLY
ncbi:MAG: proteophosphoglycan precursor [Cellvibrionales bacterium]|nr:MAG: proteophosphoglycan precursor [Cellvibrionales bacterium]